MYRTPITFANKFDVNFISFTCRVFSAGLLQITPNWFLDRMPVSSGFKDLILGNSV